MNTLLRKNLFTGILLGIAVSCMPWNAQANMAASSTIVNQEVLNEQDVKAVLWMQTSAEYRELCYQAYNMAYLQVKQAAAAHAAGNRPLAIILDADETVIDNTPLMAGCVGMSYLAHDEKWSAWCHAATAKAMPGALDYLKKVDALGVAIFYVSNRDEAADGDATRTNLKKLGFPQVDKVHVRLAQGNSNKQARFDAITKVYDVVVYMGDSAGDMPIHAHGTIAQRNAAVDAHQAEYGTRFIVFPNPTYGSWESSLAKDYAHMTPAEKDKIRKAALKPWDPAGK